MAKTKMRLQTEKNMTFVKKSKMAWMDHSVELLKFWLKIFQQIDDSGFNRVPISSQNLDFWSVSRVFYFQKNPDVFSQVHYRAPSYRREGKRHHGWIRSLEVQSHHHLSMLRGMPKHGGFFFDCYEKICKNMKKSGFLWKSKWLKTAQKHGFG